MTNWHLAPDSGRYLIAENSYWGFNIPTGSNHAKASWSQLITSTPADFFGFYYELITGNRAGYNYSFDIGIGSSGSEQSLVDDVALHRVSSATFYRLGCVYYFPFFIPAGSNMHGRGRSNYSVSETGIYGGIHGIIDNPFNHFMAARSQTMNFNPSGTNSRQIDPGGTINTWGSWADVQDGPLALNAKWVLICVNSGTDLTRSTAVWRFQLAVGGSGNEQPIIEFSAGVYTNTDLITPWIRWYPVNIPTGTSLRHRAMCDISTSGDRVINVSYHFFE